MNGVVKGFLLSSILLCVSMADVAWADEPYSNREEVEAWLAETLPLARNGYIEVNECELVLENQADGNRRVRIDFSKIGPEIIIGGTRIETEGISRISRVNEAGEFTNYAIRIDAGCVTDGGWGSDGCSAPLSFGLHRLNSEGDFASASAIHKALAFWAEICHTEPQVIPNSNPNHENVTEETICRECYDRNVAEFNEFLESIQGYSGVPADELEKVDDFYISRVGVMIHEGCLEKNFDFIEDDPLIEFEQMITDGVVRGLTGLSRGESYYRERMEGNVTSAYNLMPAFLDLLTNRSFADQDPTIDFTRVDGTRYRRALNCDNYYSIFESVHADRFPIHNKCEVIQDVPDLPKIFCSLDNIGRMYDMSHDDNFSGDGARGSIPQKNNVIVKNHNRKTKIYTGQAIFLNPEKLGNRCSARIQATIFHELFHNLGYDHEVMDDEGNIVYKGHNDYAYACQAAWFYSEFKENMEIRNVAPSNAYEFCLNNNYDPDNYSDKRNIRKAINMTYLKD